MENSLDFDRNTGGLMKTMGAEKCGRNGINMVVYLELDQQKWAQKMEELPSHQLISVVSATSTKSCWNDPVFARNKKFLDFKVRPLFFSPPKSDPQSRPKHRGVTIGGSENRLPKW